MSYKKILFATLFTASVGLSSAACAVTLTSGHGNISPSIPPGATLTAPGGPQLVSSPGPIIVFTKLQVTHGISAGDVTDNSSVIWARANFNSIMHVQLEGENFSNVNLKTIIVDSVNDFTGKISFQELTPDTEYQYRVWFTAIAPSTLKTSEAVEGKFRTAPMTNEAKPVTIAWGGDLAGQNVCRDSQQGFPIFKTIKDIQPDFFMGLGDMIYADGTCEATGRYGNSQIPGKFDKAATMVDYWAHWKYNRADTNFQKLLSSMPYYAVWDDHEVVNDFGPLHDTRDVAPYTPGVHLMPLGLKSFLDYNPIVENANTPKRLYRSIRWGKQLEMIILDTRQYRDANLAIDSATQAKSMLGNEQLVWLKDKLATSDATWKVIVSSVPLSIPTGFPPEFGRDGWANFDQNTGFEYELTDILQSLKSTGNNNVIFITTDVHFSEVFRYTPFANDPTFQVHELVSGPLSAGLFPNRNFDTTLGTESLFFFGPQDSNLVTTYKQAKSWFSFGTISIDENGTLNAAIRNINGEKVYQLMLDPK